jgi:hypothetical protein
MKKVIVTLAAIVALAACADKKTIDGVTYRPYGLINEGSCKNDSIHYEVSGWAAASGVLFSEAFLIPTVYTFGYNLWEPVCKKSQINKASDTGIVK